MISTSTLEILCEEAGLTAEQCSQIRAIQQNSPPGFGSSTGFAGTAGGNQGFGIFDDGFEEGDFSFGDAFPYQVSNPVIFESADLVSEQAIGTTATARLGTVASAAANPPRFEVATRAAAKRKPLVARVASMSQASELTEVFIPAKIAVKQPVAAAYSAHGGLVTGYSAFPPEENTYGEYLRGHDVARAQLERSFGNMISYASAYEIYVNEAL